MCPPTILFSGPHRLPLYSRIILCLWLTVPPLGTDSKREGSEDLLDPDEYVEHETLQLSSWHYRGSLEECGVSSEASSILNDQDYQILKRVSFITDEDFSEYFELTLLALSTALEPAICPFCDNEVEGEKWVGDVERYHLTCFMSAREKRLG